MNESAVFSAPWDQRLTTITLVASCLLLGGAVLVTWLALSRYPSATTRAVLLVTALIPLIAFVVGALLAPRGYAVGGGRLTIERLVRPIEIPLASIRSVERFDGEQLTGASRILGSGGFFGYYGRFRNRTIGDFRMYATRGEGYVLVRAAHPYILTPDSPDRFIAAIRGAGSGGGDPDAAPGGGR